MVNRNDLICRHCKKNAKVSSQYIVPSSLTHSVMKIDHESLRVDHVVMRKIKDFYWP